jgi:trk system potassium uptake protein TrkA
MLDSAGHEVVILDVDSYAFRRLPSGFAGRAMLGDATDQDVLRRAGIQEADAFVAVTQGDNRNVMAAQIAQHIFKVPRVITRIYDPIREELYHSLGLRTISPTKVGAQLIREAVEGEA